MADRNIPCSKWTLKLLNQLSYLKSLCLILNFLMFFISFKSLFMKSKIFIISIFLVPFISNGQNIVKKIELNCYPPNGAKFILNEPNVNSIHPAWIENFKGKSFLGSGWGFISEKIVVTPKGEFLFGHVYTSRGGKFTVKENGYAGPVYVLKNEWTCSK